MNPPDDSRIIPPHGGYRALKSYQSAEIIYDATVAFCSRFIDRRSRTYDQMVQAARSGKQNIAEGSMASGTSKKTELKLVGVARASLEELLLDYQDFLRQRRPLLWDKDHPDAPAVRKLAYEKHRSYSTYRSYVEEGSPGAAANTVICVIHRATVPRAISGTPRGWACVLSPPSGGPSVREAETGAPRGHAALPAWRERAIPSPRTRR